MSVQNETNRVQYWGNESTTTAYPVPFYFFENGDLRVVETNAAGVDRELAEGTDYSVSGAGGESGGAILTIASVPATSRVTIYREVAAVQTTVYEENGEFPAKTHERALDRQTMLNQQNARAFDRALKVRESDGGKSPLTTVANSVIGFGGDSQPRTFTPGQLAVWLNLTQQVFGEGTKAWLTEADRAMAVPDFPGQVGVQLSDSTIWASNGTSAGNWTAPTAVIPDNYILTAMLANGALSADSAGRAKMSDSFLTLAKIGAGIFTADEAGRGKFASGFVDSGLCAAGLWNAIAPVGAVLQTTVTSYSELASITTAIPSDNTIPQATEGTQVMTASITPQSSSNNVLVTMLFNGGTNSSDKGAIVTGFRSGVADAQAVGVGSQYGNDMVSTVSLRWIDSPNSTSPVVYTMRAGMVVTGATLYVNGQSDGTRAFGGAGACSILLKEIKG